MLGSGKEYEAPSTELEKTLAAAWQEVLGRERISIDDNFFEIGGDSIKAIQVSARLRKYGLKLGISDLFANPTIKQSAKYVRRTNCDRLPEQGIVEGEVELTPIQRWFFNNNFTHSHHFNMAVMLYSEKGFREEYVEKVFAKIVEHHDALRMVYIAKEDRMVQMNRGVEGKLFDLEIFNFENKCNIETEIENEANRLQAGLNLEKGLLVKLGLFKTTGGDHLLIVVHHLVIDGISWRILFEDFETGYRQLEQEETIRFQEKTDSFRYWSHKLKEYAESKALLRELPYWRAIEETKIEPLPVDYEIGRREKKSWDSEVVRMYLDEEETRKLLKEVNRAYKTNINDILLTALGLALKEWWGIKKSVVNLEGHGRETVIQDVDIGRTVGWFTSEFPVILGMSISGDLSYAIKFTKETLRRIPNKGIGYGLLKYLTPLHKKEGVSFTFTPEIGFNYLGEFDNNSNSENDGTVFTISRMKTGDAVNPDMEIVQALDINGMVMNDVLEFSFTYNKREFKSDNIRKLADCFKTNLIRIIEHCTGKEEEELTPSDVGDEELSIEEFNDIKEMVA
jgi:non-ribosomal peptide synthase protein (TIGR01720 family)